MSCALKGRTGKEDEMRIGFLGLGKMGTAMALRLVAAGHELSVWNRSEGRDEAADPRRRNCGGDSGGG